MGTFNVACSISGISIGSEDYARVILLTPSKSKKHEALKLPKTNRYLLPNDIYNPVALTIKGKYYDSGLLTDIVRDSNVEILEERYGMSIEDILASTEERNGFYDSKSPLVQRFIQNKESFLMVYDDALALTKFGFKKEGDFYTLEECPSYQIKLENCSEPYMFEIYKEGMKVYEHFKAVVLKQFAELVYEQTGQLLGVSKEDYDLAVEMYDMAAMFVHEDIYTALSNSDIETIRECHYPLDSLLKEMHDISIKKKDYQILIDKQSAAFTPKFIESLEKQGIETPELLPEDFYEISKTDNLRLFSALSEMPLFISDYRYQLEKEDISSSLVDFYYFRSAMRSANKMYLPAMNGEQNANHAATIYLAEATLNALKNKTF